MFSSNGLRKVATLAAATLFLATCQLDELVSPTEVGRLTVSEASVRDSARVGSAANRVKTATLQVTGSTGLLDFAARSTGGSSWLAVSPTTGRAPASLTVTLNPAGLALGLYQDTVLLTVPGPEDGNLRMPVEFLIIGCHLTDVLAIPASLSEAITNEDCASTRHPGHFARQFRFTGGENDSITINIGSTAFTPSLAIVAEGTPFTESLAESDTCVFGSGNSCFRYLRIPADGSYLLEVTSTASGLAGSFTGSIGPPRAPVDPSALVQQVVGGNAINVGGSVADTEVVFRATLSDPDLDSLRLELELRPVGTLLTGTATATSDLDEGPDFEIAQSGLSDDTGYHWQVRAIDETGRASGWVQFGGNASGVADFRVSVPEPPAVPTALGQLRTDGTTVVPAGGTTDESAVTLSAVVTDPDPGDQLRLEVEVRAVGTSFSGTPTAVSALVSSGEVASVVVAGLADAGSYRWQARTIDGTGRTSAWVSFGTNPANADFSVALAAARLAFITQPSGASAGAVITPAIRVAAQDAGGAVRTSFNEIIEIELAANPTGATLDGTLQVQAVSGIATFSTLRVDRAGSYTLRAAAEDMEVVSSSFTIGAGTGQLLTFSREPSNVAAGAAIAPSVQITVTDALGNTAVGFNDAITLTMGDNPSGGDLSGTLTVDAVNGVATFSNVRIDIAGIGYTILASASGTSSVESEPFNVTPGAAAALVFVAVPSTTGANGVPLAVQPAVRVIDAFGNHVLAAGRTVTATIASGPSGSSLTGATATTDAGGLATFESLAVNGEAGIYSLSFGSTGVTSVTAPVSLGAGSVSALSIVTQPSANAASGVSFAQQPVLQLVDASGNEVALAGVSVTAALSSGTGTLGGTLTVASNAEGRVVFSDLSITGSSGSRTLIFTSTDLTSATSGSITLGAGAATEIELSAGDEQSAVAGSAVAIAPAVRVVDASGNPVAGVAVAFAVTGGGGTVLPTEPVVTGANGIAALTSWTLGASAGANSLTASVGGLTGSPIVFTATGTAGAAASLLISGGNNLSGQVGSTLATQHEVRVVDANANPVSDVIITWSVTGGGSVSPVTSVTNADGRATSTRTLGGTAGPQGTVASATLPGGPAEVLFSLTATVGGATRLETVSGDAQIDTVGATLPVPLSVRALDGLNNPVAGVIVSWGVVAGGGSVDPASSTTGEDGIATASWTLGQVTTATDSTQVARASGVGSPISFVATARPGNVSVTRSLVSASPGTIVASRTSPSTVTVTARDGFDNRIPGESVVLAAVDGGGAVAAGANIIQPAGVTAANGVVTGSFGSTVSGSYSIIAVIGGDTVVARPGVTVNPAPATALRYMQQPTNVVAGSQIAPAVTVEALDSLGNRNTTTGASVTAALDANPGVSTLGGTLVRTFTGGVATFGDLTLNRVATGYTLAVSAPGMTGSVSSAFDVAVGGVSAAQSDVALSAGSIVAGGTGSDVTVTVRDASGNPVPAQTVLLEVSGTDNTVTPGSSVQTNASGVATFTVSSTRAESKTVVARVGALALGVTQNLVVTPAVVSDSASTVESSASSVGPGAQFSISAVASDRFGNRVAGAAVTMTPVVADNVTDHGGEAVTDATGEATRTFSSGTAGAKRVAVSLAGVFIDTVRVTVTPGGVSAGASLVELSRTSVVAGDSGTTVTVTAIDAFTNPVPGANVVLAVTGAGNTVTPVSPQTDALGRAVFIVSSTIIDAVAKTVSATIGAVAVTQTGTFTVTPAAVSGSESELSGVPVTSVAGSAVPVQVTARDEYGNAVPGAAVVMQGVIGATTLTSNQTTNASGVAIGSLTPLTTGSMRVSATVAGVALGDSVSVAVTAGGVSGAQSGLVIAPATMVAGESVPVVVTARDANGNPVSGQTVVVSSTVGSDVVTPVADGITDGSGVATFNLVSTVAGPSVLSATAGGVAIVQTDTVAVTPAAPAAASTRVGPAGNVVAGADFSITVTARDQYSNLVPGAAITLTTVPAESVTPVDTVLTANASGVAVGVFSSNVAGTKTIAVQVGSVTLAPVSVTVVAGGVSGAQSGLVVTPVTTVAGSTVPVVVTARDASGNPVSGQAVVVSSTVGSDVITAVGGGTTGVDGVATFNLVPTVVGQRVLSATAGGVVIVQTDTIAVTAAALSAANSLIGVSQGTIVAGDSQGTTVTVTARDQYGNPLSGLPVVLLPVPDSVDLDPVGAVNTGVNGQSVFELTSSTIGPVVVGATISGTTITPTAAVTVEAGAVSATASTATGPVGSVMAGSQFAINAVARNEFGVAIPGAAVAISSLPAQNVTTDSVSALTSASGSAAGYFRSTLAGSKQMTVTLGGVAVDIINVTVVPAAVDAAGSSLSISADSVTTLETATITVTAEDAHGNRIAGAAVVLSLSDGAGESEGAFGVVTEVGNGVYTVVFTPTASGTSATISATINTVLIGATTTITVTEPEAEIP